MSQDFHAKLDEAARLADAYAKLDPAPPLEDYLARHASVRDLLEPMLGNGSDPLPDFTDLDEDLSLEEPAPESIGPFKILHRIGAGGFGVVYVAEQREPLRRRVAIKILRRDRSTKQVLARFEIERQALARMSHANVAQVHDAGLLEDGRPYFVMEYVAGVSITEYCDEHKVSIRDRLDLFLRVCDAIQHAHQRGILHRDIKPTNILVSLQDGRPVPKVIDFGVAKDYTGGLSGETCYTRDGQVIGTPEYMSPEQACLTALDVDTRTDVYSLGVLLYELISGTLPFEHRELRKIAFDQMLRRIRETDPPKPSSRVSTSLDPHEATQIADRRRLDRRALVRKLSGDLDWIVMKSLEKDRMRRYASVSELAADVGRHLRQEPVEAGPPSAVYRLHRFVQRNRLMVAAGVIVVAGLAVASGVLAVALRQATAANRDLERSAENAARALQRSEAIRTVLDVLLANFDIMGEAGEDLRVSDALLLASEGIEGLFDGSDPEFDAVGLDYIGVAMRNYDELGRAEELLSRALEMRRDHLGEDHPDTIASASHWYELVGDRNRDAADVVRALDALEALLERARRELGEDHEVTIDVLQAHASMLHQTAQRMKGEARDVRLLEAERQFRRAIRVCVETFGAKDPRTFRAKKNLANCLVHRARYQESDEILREVFADEEAFYNSERHARRLVTMCHLGGIQYRQGEYLDAADWYRQCVEMSTAVLGPDHSQTLLRVGNRGKSLLHAGETAEARAMLHDAHDRAVKSLGEDSGVVSVLMAYMGEAELMRGADASRRGEDEVAREALEHAKDLATKAVERLGSPGVHNLARRVDAALEEAREAAAERSRQEAREETEKERSPFGRVERGRSSGSTAGG